MKHGERILFARVRLKRLFAEKVKYSPPQISNQVVYVQRCAYRLAELCQKPCGWYARATVWIVSSRRGSSSRTHSIGSGEFEL